MKNLIYIFLGTCFGIVMYKSEAASWFRIYEMFNFQSFHMYGIIGSALGLGIIIMQWIKRSRLKDITGEDIHLQDKSKSITRYLVGGILFGLGWALAGACPGPLFVLLGAGYLPILIVILGALLGTWLYGLLKDKLPH
ncbi:YeeE/YedE family protein [Sphingobacterium sp. LRF_L2]|uniref:YeeE/YedE family protein n=1 Tax=Sphingobacterium sp. LRF_L2 TaxID=3369421 RepID=UPI003F63A9E4